MDNYKAAIVDVLTKATSQNAELIKKAEQQLKNLETQCGFYTMLMTVVLDRSLDVNVRWLASVCLKNGIDRYWRKTAPNALSAEEKTVLKQQFVLCMDEPVHLVARQIALIISKVARLDIPGSWPELFPALSNTIQNPDDIHQHRGLLVLHHVVKSLSSKRLLQDQQMFQELTPSLFPSIINLWLSYCNRLLQEVENLQYGNKSLLEKCLFCLKVLRKLIVYGFKEPAKNSDAMNFMTIIFQQFKPFLEFRKRLLNDTGMLETCEKYLFTLVKVLLDVLEQHALSFVQFVRPTLECAVTFCFTEEYRESIFERFTVGHMNLIKEILTSKDFKSTSKSKGSKPEAIQAEKIRIEFFTVPILGEVIRQLVMRYFLLTQHDISLWEENPEEFAMEEQGESWKFNLRPCTEVLFMSLFREYSDIVAPLLMEMINTVMALKGTDFTTMLKKEAVLNSAGLASFDLYDYVDFDKWFINVLIPELRIQENNYHIVRRRIVWLLGKWVQVKLSVETRPLLYEVIIQVLGNKENLLVRLAASHALIFAVDDLHFDVQQFAPYLGQIFTELFNLLQEVKECDSKMSVIHSITFLIERVDKTVVDVHVELLIHYLHRLWDGCGDHMMLRCTILTCFSQLVCSLEASSENLHPILIPMIQFGSDPNLPGHVYLLEDSMILWCHLVQQATVCTTPLLDLAENLTTLIEQGQETFEKGVELMTAYILLSPKDYLQRFGEKIVASFIYMMTDLNYKAGAQIMKIVEISLILFPVESSVLFKPIIAIALSHVLESDECNFSLSYYLCVLSRIVLQNLNCFVCVLQEKAAACKQEVDKIFAFLLDVWLKKSSSIYALPDRKLLGLALACLLTSNSEIIHYQICGVLLAIVEILNDIVPLYVDSNINHDLLVNRNREENSEENDEPSTYISAHEKRVEDLHHNDPIYRVVLKDYLRTQLTTMEQSLGIEKFNDLMSTVDVETMQQLKDHLKI